MIVLGILEVEHHHVWIATLVSMESNWALFLSFHVERPSFGIPRQTVTLVVEWLEFLVFVVVSLLAVRDPVTEASCSPKDILRSS